MAVKKKQMYSITTPNSVCISPAVTASSTCMPAGETGNEKKLKMSKSKLSIVHHA